MTTTKGSHFRTYITSRDLWFLNAWSGILVRLLFWSKLKENENLDFRVNNMTSKVMSKLRTNVNNRKAPTRWMMLMIQLLRTSFEDLTYSRRLYQGFSWFCFRRETWKKKYNRTYTFLFIQSVNEYNLKLIVLKKLYTPKEWAEVLNTISYEKALTRGPTPYLFIPFLT